MTITPTVTPQTIPDQLILPQGEMGSRATYFLRATPRIFTVIMAGQSNQDFQIAAVQPVELPQVFLGSRSSRGARQGGTTVVLEASLVGLGVVGVALSLTQRFATTIAGAGEVVPGLVRARNLFATLIGTGSVVADQSGGTLGGGGLILTPEDPDQSLILTEETGDSQTLTNEDPPDSLTLTPA